MLIKWKGIPVEDNSWEQISNIPLRFPAFHPWDQGQIQEGVLMQCQAVALTWIADMDKLYSSLTKLSIYGSY